MSDTDSVIQDVVTGDVHVGDVHHNQNTHVDQSTNVELPVSLDEVSKKVASAASIVGKSSEEARRRHRNISERNNQSISVICNCNRFGMWVLNLQWKR